MRRNATRLWQSAPQVYPFRKPFYDTPYDEDRHRFDVTKASLTDKPYPEWLDKGANGYGRGIGVERTHPLSKLKGNFSREAADVPRMVQMMAKGVLHASGKYLYRRKVGKAPNPSRQPYLTGEPCPVYGWKHTDTMPTRKFETPFIQDRNRYKPYVGVQERQIVENTPEIPSAKSKAPVAGAGSAAQRESKESKPLLKRLFFWK